MVEKSSEFKESKGNQIEEFKKIKDRLPNSLFEKNRERFVKLFKNDVGADKAKKGIALFKGASEVPLYSSDIAYPEYQEAYFYYLFGVSEMDCFAVIDFATEKPILFAP